MLLFFTVYTRANVISFYIYCFDDEKRIQRLMPISYSIRLASRLIYISYIYLIYFQVAFFLFHDKSLANAPNNENETPLHVACLNSSVRIMNRLIEFEGVLFKEEDEFEKTPLNRLTF